MRLMSLVKHSFIWTLISCAVAGCSDSERAKFRAIGNKHKVQMYSGGQCVRTWTSTGMVHNEKNSDGYYFNDSETGNLITVSGDVVVEALP
jgi:hypothetical protein